MTSVAAPARNVDAYARSSRERRAPFSTVGKQSLVCRERSKHGSDTCNHIGERRSELEVQVLYPRCESMPCARCAGLESEYPSLERRPSSYRVRFLFATDKSVRPDSGYLERTLSSHFSKVVWLDGSISVKAIPIPYFGFEYTTLPEATKNESPRTILSETFVPSGNGFPVST